MKGLLCLTLSGRLMLDRQYELAFYAYVFEELSHCQCIKALSGDNASTQGTAQLQGVIPVSPDSSSSFWSQSFCRLAPSLPLLRHSALLRESGFCMSFQGQALYTCTSEDVHICFLKHTFKISLLSRNSRKSHYEVDKGGTPEVKGWRRR